MKKKNLKILFLLFMLMLINIDFVSAKSCITCGKVDAIPVSLATFSRNAITFVQVLVPVIIIIMGMVGFLKAIIDGDEKAFAQARTHLIRMIIAGIVILLIITIVKMIFGLVGQSSDDMNSAMKCISCFTTDENACNITACPERESGNSGNSSGNSNNNQSQSGTNHGGGESTHDSSSNSSSVPNSTVKSCGDRATLSECNADTNCKWSYSGSFCEVNSTGQNATTKLCGDYGTLSECNADTNCKWSYSGSFCEVK